MFEDNGFTARQYEFSMERPQTRQDTEVEPSFPEGFALVGFEMTRRLVEYVRQL